MMNNRSRAIMDEIDRAVLAALGDSTLYLKQIEDRTKHAHGQSTIIRALRRLQAAGKIMRIEKPREKKNGRPAANSPYVGHGPQPTVFWRRV